ncbi:acyl carrier protein [Octadecabacter antarcticus 307]|uniref:Acyl carrier protein n=1 Tax=Octadecabacter antarcticus 307 TaxID=391626 RepID=M9RC71_9RHOB|nr:acyl carrier protein [Octadecabacter antarcticus]AGI67966.1 acyl carrier protein [Octadecabacter antarcticus 307]
MNITAQVLEIIAQQALLQPGDVKIEHTLEDLGIDSLGLVESIFAIEEAFDINVPFNANDPSGGDFDITSVGAIIKAVQTLVQDQT